MENGEQDRSEKPTSFKLQKARQKGAVARGMDLGFLTGLVAFTGYAWIAGPDILSSIAHSSHDVLIAGPQLAQGNQALLSLVTKLFMTALQPLLVMAAVVFLIALVFEILQTGIVFSAQPLKPDFSRLNPAKGIKRLFSLRLLIETFKNILKLAVYSLIGWMAIQAAVNSDIGSISDAHSLAKSMHYMGLRLLFAFIFGAFLFAVLDQMITRRDFYKRMRMSRREIKREHREREGEPRLKQKRKQLHTEFVKTSKSLRGLRSADVVITNPTHIAVALQYDPATMAAPIIVSLGSNRVAERLKMLALRYGIPVVENRTLARALISTCKHHDQIPEICFQPVAKIYNNLRKNTSPKNG